MNLSQLKKAVHKDPRVKEMRLRQDEVKIVVDVIIDHIVSGLLKYGVVKLRGLFTLRIREAKGRKIANPQTGEEMYIDDYNKINLEPSKRLKDGLKNYEK